MTRFLIALPLLLASASTLAGNCASRDLAGQKWHVFTNNAAARYCLISVSAKGKTSGYCRSEADLASSDKNDNTPLL